MENYFTTKLSPEIILKILLYLNCDELSAIKRTCHYFNCFIEANRDELAKKEFTNISIINPKEEKIKYKKVDIRNGVVPHSPSLGQFKNLLKNLNFANARTLYQEPNCIANREPIFENEWNAAIKNCTSVYIRTGRDKVIYPSLEKLAIKLAFSRMDSQRNQKQNKLRSMEFYHKEIAKLHGNLVLKLPVFPKTIVEMKIIRFWLRKLFNCKFREVLFGQYIINPEIIEILFDKEELEKLQFHTQIAHLTYCNTVSLYYHEGFRKIMTYDHEIDMVFKFNVKHLRISQLLSLDARYYKETPQNNDILLKLFSKGAKIPHIQINYDWKLTICNLIIKYLQSLSNYTKIVPIIVLDKTPVLRGSLDINLFIRKECSSGLIIYYKEYIKNNIKILIEFYLDDSERVIKAKFRKFK